MLVPDQQKISFSSLQVGVCFRSIFVSQARNVLISFLNAFKSNVTFIKNRITYLHQEHTEASAGINTSYILKGTAISEMGAH